MENNLTLEVTLGAEVIIAGILKGSELEVTLDSGRELNVTTNFIPTTGSGPTFTYVDTRFNEISGHDFVTDFQTGLI